MRVLQVMECTIGGTRRHLLDLCNGLVDRGHDVELACAALREPAMRQDMQALRGRGVRVHEIPMVRAIRPGRDLLHASRLMAVLADRGFDVLHTHSSKAGALGRLAGWLVSGAARVHTPHTYAASFHGGHGQGGEAAGPLGLIMATERFLGRLTNRLIHVSRDEQEEGERLRVISDNRARVVANGIDPERFARPSGGPALRAELGIPADAPLVGSVGLLNDAKGHDILLEALSSLPPTTHCLLVGHGEREPLLREQAARLGLEARVHFAGWRDEVGSAHHAMDVFVLPSRWEGLSYALLEALAAGVPVVSTQVNGSREVLTPEGAEACGLVVPREDPLALAQALGRLLEDSKLRQQFVARGVSRVAADFSLEHMLDRTLAVYREALGRSEPGPT